jgi:hypothetical protein
MIRQLLEGLLPRECQNFPQRHGERPDVTLARVPSLRRNKRVQEYLANVYRLRVRSGARPYFDTLFILPYQSKTDV